MLCSIDPSPHRPCVHMPLCRVFVRDSMKICHFRLEWFPILSFRRLKKSLPLAIIHWQLAGGRLLRLDRFLIPLLGDKNFCPGLVVLLTILVLTTHQTVSWSGDLDWLFFSLSFFVWLWPAAVTRSPTCSWLGSLTVVCIMGCGLPLSLCCSMCTFDFFVYCRCLTTLQPVSPCALYSTSSPASANPRETRA